MSTAIEVVAAVVRRGDRVLLCQRHDGDHLPLMWEFPGGKIEAGETPAMALLRELQEELGVASRVGNQIAEARHDYPEKRVRLRFFEAAITGTPEPRVHRQLRWVPMAELGDYTVPPPNARVVALLQNSSHSAVANLGPQVSSLS